MNGSKYPLKVLFSNTHEGQTTNPPDTNSKLATPRSNLSNKKRTLLEMGFQHLAVSPDLKYASGECETVQVKKLKIELDDISEMIGEEENDIPD